MPNEDWALSQSTVDVRNEGRRHANRGDSQLFPTPPRLTERQQYVYRLTEHGHTTPDQAGIELHKRQRCPWCTPDAPCRYATSNGREVLEALRKKGLLVRDRHHVYRRADQTVSAQTDSIPY